MGASSTEQRGLLFMLVGPGGVGKNALLQKILPRVPDLCQLPTATTRPPRAGEIHGVHHYFVSLEEFNDLIAADALLEYQEVHPGKFYGVPRHTLEAMVANRQYRIADIEFKGATRIRATYPHNSIAIFIAPPTYESLVTRLHDRQATPDQIDERLTRLAEEMPYAPQCDYIVINDDMSAAVDELQTIFQAERNQPTGPGYVPTNSVTFTVEVLPVFGDELLVQEKTERRVPCSTFLRGHDLTTVASDTLADVLSINVIPANIHYGVPDSSRPVIFDYAPDSRSYALTFRYSYHMNQRLAPPEGWDWIPVEQFTGG